MMSLEIKKGSGSSVSNFLNKRGNLVKQIIVHDGSISKEIGEGVSGKLTSLQTITVAGRGVSGEDSNVTDEDIIALQKLCGNSTAVSRLNLDRVDKVSFPVLDDFLAGFVSLTNLSLNYCSSFNDASLTSVASNCRNLRVVSLRSTDIGDNGLSIFAQKCSTLTNADFGECSKITDVGVEAVASGNKGLLEIRVDRCPSVTESSVLALARECRNLTVISMEATGIRKLPSAVVCLEKLKQLKLSNCKQLIHPPQDVVIGGLKRLMNFFIDFQLTYRIKLFVIGEPGVGKSALIKCLTNDDPLHSLTGFGGVSLWDPSSVDSVEIAQGKYIFEIWELPDDVLGLGDTFYIEPAIYIVTYDLLESRNIDSVLVTVSSIWARIPHACIIVVGTHAESLDLTTLQENVKFAEQQLKRLIDLRTNLAKKIKNQVAKDGTDEYKPLFEGHVKFLTSMEAKDSSFKILPVSCRSRQGIQELRQNLMANCGKHSALFPQLSYKLTPSLVQLYENIRQLRLRSTVVVPWPEFAYMAEHCGITVDQVEDDTKFLHNAGIIFDFRYLKRSITSRLESYICIDPAKLLELYSNMHSSMTMTYSMENPDFDDIFSNLIERGLVLGRMLPSIWKITDTDQLEMLESLARQLGIMCPVSSALPPAAWDKQLPQLPLGCHRCSFIRKVYSLPHFFQRLPKLQRPIHWQPEIAEDISELSIHFKTSPELVSILESTFQRIIASLPSLYYTETKMRPDLDLFDWNLSNGIMLVRFNLYLPEDSPPVVIETKTSISDHYGITISTRLCSVEVPENEFQLVLWFYTVILGRALYFRLCDQLGGLPMTIEAQRKNRQAETEYCIVKSFLAMIASWRAQDESKLYPPIPFSDDLQHLNLHQLLNACGEKLRLHMKQKGLEYIAKSLLGTKKGEPKPVFKGDGIIVNEGCFRRGKNKKLSVTFYDASVRNMAPRSPLVLHGSQATVWSPNCAYKPSQRFKVVAGVTRTNAMNFREAVEGNSLYRSDSCDPTYESLDHSASVTKDSIFGDVYEMNDKLSVLSGAQIGSLRSLDSGERMTPNSLGWTIRDSKKKRRCRSPPPGTTKSSDDNEYLRVEYESISKSNEGLARDIKIRAPVVERMAVSMYADPRVNGENEINPGDEEAFTERSNSVGNSKVKETPTQTRNHLSVCEDSNRSSPNGRSAGRSSLGDDSGLDMEQERRAASTIPQISIFQEDKIEDRNATIATCQVEMPVDTNFEPPMSPVFDSSLPSSATSSRKNKKRVKFPSIASFRNRRKSSVSSETEFNSHPNGEPKGTLIGDIKGPNEMMIAQVMGSRRRDSISSQKKEKYSRCLCS